MSAGDDAAFRIPAGTTLGRVRLRVRDLARSHAFYGDVLGFEARESGLSVLEFGAGDTETALELSADPAARPRRPDTAGLYHVAFLLPDRASLGAALARLIDARYPLQGFADHHVSDAVYLADPDGNGVELYADRPRAAWRLSGGSVFMTTKPLDVDALLADRATADSQAMPPGTRVGHIHLQVTDLAAAEAFYHGTLGFDVVNRDFPGARFLSAGGYHHHIGLNTWGRPRPPDPGTAGLIEFEVRLPDAAALRAVEERVEPEVRAAATAGPPVRISDPDRNTLLITA